MFEKLNRSLKYNSKFFGPQTYVDTNTNRFTPLALHVRVKNGAKGPTRNLLDVLKPAVESDLARKIEVESRGGNQH